MSKTIPSNAAETDVDLYLRFSFSKDFPAGTILTLTSATNSWTISDVNTKDFVYSSLEFSSVQLTNNYLEFEVA